MVDSYDDYAAGVLQGRSRCGCLDSQFLGESRWAMNSLTYAFASYPTGAAISKEIVEAEIRAAFDAWSAVAGLTFTQTDNTSAANILISAARGKRNNFDGPSGVLAWCELPPGNSFRGQVNLCFDLDEAWDQQIPLRNVATHEIGHGLGLSHTNVKNQLMNPFLSSIKDPQSHDIAEIQSLYGKPVAVPSTPTPPPSPAPTGAPKAVKILGSDGRVWGASSFVEIPANAVMEGEQWQF